MFPLEVLTFLGSSVTGGIMKIVAKKVEIDKLTNARTAGEAKAMGEAIAEARKYQPAGGVWTRRTIVWAMLFTVFVAPVILSFYGIPIVYGYSETKGSFLWGLFGGKLSEMKFVEMAGMVLLPVHVHIATAVGGFYFGTAAIK